MTLNAYISNDFNNVAYVAPFKFPLSFGTLGVPVSTTGALKFFRVGSTNSTSNIIAEARNRSLKPFCLVVGDVRT